MAWQQFSAKPSPEPMLTKSSDVTRLQWIKLRELPFQNYRYMLFMIVTVHSALNADVLNERKRINSISIFLMHWSYKSLTLTQPYEINNDPESSSNYFYQIFLLREYQGLIQYEDAILPV